MSEYSLLDIWWRQTAEFQKIAAELEQHDIFLFYGPPAIGKKTLLGQLDAGRADQPPGNVCCMDFHDIPGLTWDGKCTWLKNAVREKQSRLVVKATIFDFFEIHGIRKTTERKNLAAYTKELKNWIRNLSDNLGSLEETGPWYHSLHISHDDAGLLLEMIASGENLKTNLDDDARKLLLRYARISSDDVGTLRIPERTGYYFPILLREGLLEIRDPATKSIDTGKLGSFRTKVEKNISAEQILLPKPHFFPLVDLALVPFLWETIQSPRSKLAGQVGQNFLQFLSSDGSPLQKLLENILMGVPIAGIGFAFLFYFTRKEDEDIGRTLTRIPQNWKALPPAKRKAIGECYDGFFGLERGTTEGSFDAISDIGAEELERRLRSVENEVKALRKEVDEIKTLYGILSAYLPSATLEKGGRWYETKTLDFREELERLRTGFVGRDWLFTELKTWAARQESRILLLTGDTGIGKSAIAAHLTTIPATAGIHFCSRSITESCRPTPWLQALICQLALQFPPYRMILDQITTPPNWNDPPESLFRNLVSDKLAACREKLHTEGSLVFVIDGLDEADPAMVTFLLETIPRIPPWLRLIITSRPDNQITDRFRNAGAMIRHIGKDDTGNLKDVSRYLDTQYHELIQKGILPETPGLIKRLEDRCEGNFLYASVLMTAMGDKDPTKRITMEDIGKLPKHLNFLYDLMFSRRFADMENYERKVRPLLDCLTAAQAPLPESLLVSAAGISQPDAYSGLRSFSQFLIHDNEGYRLFHKSIGEWLVSSPGSNRFAAYTDEGHRHLADTGLKEVDATDQTLSNYTLRWLPIHLLQMKRTGDLAALLANPRYFIPLCEMSGEQAREIWATVESTTTIRMTGVYAPVINEPSRFSLEYKRYTSLLLYYFGHYSESLRLSQILEEHARITGDADGIVYSLGNQSLIHQKWGDLNLAMELLKKQEQICRELGNNAGLCLALEGQVRIHNLQGDLDRAMELLQEQEQICRELGNQTGLQNSFGSQADIYKEQGNLDRAMELLKKQEQICRELGNQDGLQNSFGSQAYIYIKQGNLDRAMELLKEQERICHELGYKDGLRNIFEVQAIIHIKQGNLDRAMELLKKQEQICRELGSKDGLALSLWSQATILGWENHDWRNALSLIEEAYRYAEASGVKSLADKIRGYVDEIRTKVREM